MNRLAVIYVTIRNGNYRSLACLSCLLVFSLFAEQSVSQEQLRDYQLLSHNIFVSGLRSGNHDKSGINEYFFELAFFAIKNDREALGMEIEKRTKEAFGQEQFGEVQIKVLTQWKPQGDVEKLLSFKVYGDRLRNILSSAMRTFKVSEEEVGVMVEISMYEKNKTLGYFGEDTLISKTNYFPVAPRNYTPQPRTNLKLELTDPEGTLVELKVKYDTPITNTQKTKDSAKNDEPSVPL